MELNNIVNLCEFINETTDCEAEIRPSGHVLLSSTWYSKTYKTKSVDKALEWVDATREEYKTWLEDNL